MKLHLVPDWRQCWRWFCIHAMALALAFQGAWLAVPDDLRAMLPATAAQAITMVLLVLGVLGRLVDQPAARSGDPK